MLEMLHTKLYSSDDDNEDDVTSGAATPNIDTKKYAQDAHERQRNLARARNSTSEPAHQTRDGCGLTGARTHTNMLTRRNAKNEGHVRAEPNGEQPTKDPSTYQTTPSMCV